MHLSQEQETALTQMLPEGSLDFLNQAAAAVIQAKQKGGKVVAVVGSGPNIHEGVTTLIAHLISKGLVDGVITSSAVINHEISGALDRVHRVKVADLPDLGLPTARDAYLEATLLPADQLAALKEELQLDETYYQTLLKAPGKDIIKAAGNMAYPMGLRTEKLAREIQSLAAGTGLPFEAAAGLGADPNTMLGAGAIKGVPVLVGVPQLVGGGAVGLAVGDSLPITGRSHRIARMLDGADVIIESAVALTQEIHDGPFETYTGHGIWSHQQGHWTFSLENKTLIRMDLDPNLMKAWQFERQKGTVSRAIAEGLPKTKLMDVPFRMEMSGFARLPGSLPVIGDIGVVWPLMIDAVTDALGLSLDFLSFPQSTSEGEKMRDWIVSEVLPVDRQRVLENINQIGKA